MKKQNKRTKSKKKSRKKHKKSSNSRTSSNANVQNATAKASVRESKAAPVPERPVVKKTKTNTNALNQKKSFVDKISQFLREAKTELIKVKWPNKKELLSTTFVVIILSLFVAFYLGAVDFVLIKIIKIVVR